MPFQAVGKKLAGPVSDWEVVKFQRIPNTAYPELPYHVLEDFNYDQYYSYRFVGR